MEFKLAIIILAHKNQSQLEILLDTLIHKNINIYVHLDRKMKITLLNCKNPNVRYFSSFSCSWASYSVVKATLLCLDKAVEDKNDYISLISGQDLPLVLPDEIYNFFQNKANNNYLNYYEFNDFFYDDYILYNHYFFHFSNTVIAFPSYEKPANKLMSYFHKSLDFVIKKKRFNLKLFYGQQWLNIKYNSAEKILNFVKSNKSIEELFQYSILPENFVFPTILNLLDELESTENECFRFVDWIRLEPNSNPLIYDNWNNPRKSNHPRIFREDDLKLLKNASKDNIFARKFDITVDANIIKKILSGES